MHVASGDRFVSFKAGEDRRDDSFFFYRAGYRMAGREESCLIFCQLFPFMHVVSGDRFVSFKEGGDRRDGSFFFYRAEYRMAGREEYCLIFANCFLPCMIIVSFHACGIK